MNTSRIYQRPMSALLTVLNVGLDAVGLGITRDDYLSAVAILHAPDPILAALEGPKTLTLDALLHVAWAHGLDLRVAIKP